MHINRRTCYSLLLLSMTFLVACTRSYNYPELVSGDVVLTVGDQFTAGTGASARFAYPDLLAQSTNARVINLGRAGSGAADIMRVMRPALAGGRVKLVVLTIGFNDLHQGADLRFLKGYLTEAATVLDRMKIPLMLVGIPALPYKGASKPHPVYDDIAASYKLIYEPSAFIEVLKVPQNMETPAQFTADGYRVFAENIEERLRAEGFLR